MAIAVKQLAKGSLTSAQDLYTTPINKTAIVKSIRLVNTTGSAVTVNLYVRRGSAGSTYRIAPVSLSLPGNSMYVDESEVTLEGGVTLGTTDDRIYGDASAAVHFVISGVERDV
jgi:hypothetical protein